MTIAKRSLRTFSPQVDRSLRVALLFSMFAFVFSCNSKNSGPLAKDDSSGMTTGNPDTTKLKGGGEPRLQTSDELFVYFLKNTEFNRQLDTLVDASRGNNKIVLQLYRDSAGSLALSAWPGKGGKDSFQINDMRLLTRGSLSAESLSGKNVFLGNMEIGPKAIKKLRSLLYRPHGSNPPENKYIMFFPQIRPVDGTPHLFYIVQNASDSSKTEPALQQQGDKTLVSFQANPSPPRNVDGN